MIVYSSLLGLCKWLFFETSYTPFCSTRRGDKSNLDRCTFYFGATKIQ